MSAVDFLGQDLVVGSRVAFVQLNYRNLLTGTVTKITPKMVDIRHEETNMCSTETRQFHDQVIVIDHIQDSKI